MQNVNIWLGGLFTTEAYITATRQYVAQANNWSLEELYLDVSIMFIAEWSHVLIKYHSVTIYNYGTSSLTCRFWWTPLALPTTVALESQVHVCVWEGGLS